MKITKKLFSYLDRLSLSEETFEKWFYLVIIPTIITLLPISILTGWNLSAEVNTVFSIWVFLSYMISSEYGKCVLQKLVYLPVAMFEPFVWVTSLLGISQSWISNQKFDNNLKKVLNGKLSERDRISIKEKRVSLTKNKVQTLVERIINREITGNSKMIDIFSVDITNLEMVGTNKTAWVFFKVNHINGNFEKETYRPRYFSIRLYGDQKIDNIVVIDKFKALSDEAHSPEELEREFGRFHASQGLESMSIKDSLKFDPLGHVRKDIESVKKRKIKTVDNSTTSLSMERASE